MARRRPRRASGNKRQPSSARPVGTEPGTGGGKWLHIAISMKPYVVVFIASACILIIEIVAARILAPTIGVSLYTWTGIIGVVLAGISTGNYLGGRVADRFPSGITLGIILLAGGASSMSVLALVNVVSEAFDALSAIPRIIFVTTTLFFLPSLILGMVTPVVIKLRLQDLANTGSVVGKIYAVSTTGSIFGTFITGFVLIQWIGTRAILFLVALVLIFAALAFGDLWRAKVRSFSLIALFVALGSLGIANGTLDSGCVRESNYYCIRVSDEIAEGGMRVKVLQLDKLRHSSVSLEDPTFLETGYQKVLEEIEGFIAQHNPSLRVLFIGGGGYTMPRYIEAVYPQSTVEVIEIDPEITRVAFDYLGLRPDTRIETYNQDARMVVPKLAPAKYDLVVGDTFHDISIPYHLTTREFNEQVRTLLKENGIYAVNVIDKLHTGRFLRTYVHTLQQTFPFVYLARDDAGVWEDDSRTTFVVLGAIQALSPTDIEAATVRRIRSRPVSQFMSESTFKSWLNLQNFVLLTDDYAPVDNLTAPVYLARSSSSAADKHYSAGLELQNQRRYTEAIAEYDAAIRLNPQYQPAYNNRGIIYDDLGELKRAIVDYDEAIRLAPKGALVYNNRGGVYFKLGQYQRAIQDYDEAIRLAPQLVQVYMNRAMAYTYLGDDTAAEKDVERAVKNGANRASLERVIENLKDRR